MNHRARGTLKDERPTEDQSAGRMEQAMNEVAETTKPSTLIPTHISGIGNTKTPILIGVVEHGEAYLTDVELASVCVHAKLCGGPAPSCFVRLRLDSGKCIAAKVYLEDGDAYVDGDDHGHIDLHLEPMELSKLRQAVRDMLLEAADGDDLRPLATLESASFRIVDGEGNQLNPDLSKVGAS